MKACAVLTEAAAADSQESVAIPPAAPDDAAVVQARHSQLLARAQALRDCNWLDYDPGASDELAEAKQSMLDFLREVERNDRSSNAAAVA